MEINCEECQGSSKVTVSQKEKKKSDISTTDISINLGISQ